MTTSLDTEPMETADAGSPSLEVLVINLGGEEYAIDIQKVQELRGCDAVTRIVNAPDHVLGVINLRGTIVPVIDMRVRFGLGTPVFDQFTVVAILSVGRQVTGIVVDGVSDVVRLDASQMKPVPPVGAVMDAGILQAIGTVDNRMLMLLDAERLMSGEEAGVAGALAP